MPTQMEGHKVSCQKITCELIELSGIQPCIVQRQRSALAHMRIHSSLTSRW
jgi:hypothetical protein